MSTHSDEAVKTSTFPLPLKYTFYKKSADDIELTIYSVKPFTFDLMLAVCVLSYLGIFYLASQVTLDQNVVSLFR